MSTPSGTLWLAGIESIAMHKSKTTLRIAIVHDWLTTRAGSEKVLGEILRMFPEAELFSLVDFLPDSERDFLQGRTVKTSFLQRMPFGKGLFRKLLWLLPFAIESFDLTGFDLVITSSHAVAKGVITGPDQTHICYCHSPMRYAWDLQHQYLRETGMDTGVRSAYARLTLHYLRIWDLRSINGVDQFIANSTFIARRIRKIYGRDAVVIHPPVELEKFKCQAAKREFYVTASRLVPYKRVNIIIEAFNLHPDRTLIVVGDGPGRAECEKLSGPNVKILGYRPDEELRQLLREARAFIYAAEEDFGISIVEAQASGTPVICYGKGGALDSVIPGRTGLFFYEQTPTAINEAISTFEQQPKRFDPFVIRENAERFGTAAFRKSLTRLLLDRTNMDLSNLPDEPLCTSVACA